MEITTTTWSVKKCTEGLTLVIDEEDKGTLTNLETIGKEIFKVSYFLYITLLEMYPSDHVYTSEVKGLTIGSILRALPG